MVQVVESKPLNRKTGRGPPSDSAYEAHGRLARLSPPVRRVAGQFEEAVPQGLRPANHFTRFAA